MDPKTFNVLLFIEESAQWRTDVEFCRDEIKILNRYLQEIVDKNINPDRRVEVVHYQQLLSHQMEEFYDLLGLISVHEEMFRLSCSDVLDMDNAHASLRIKVKEQDRSYSDLKSSFVRFLAKSDFIM